MKTWEEVYANAREKCTICRCCPVCNGNVCRGLTPGPGGKGSGESFVRNAQMLKKIWIHMDTITNNEEVSTASEFFAHPVSLPVFAAPISGIRQNYGADMDDLAYTEELIAGCLAAGTLAFSGDGKTADMFRGPVEIVKKYQGQAVPTVKPWSLEHMKWRIELAQEAGAFAIASDIDASGLINLRTSETPVCFKSVEDLKQVKALCEVPFILKGIMTVRGAMKALEAGADGIIISNHGGRVLDDALSGIEVLEEIAKAVDGRMKIFVDGAFRSGSDVFKALALGADGVLIGRPVSHAVIGGGREGLRIYLEKLQLELKETMAMSGCKSIRDITRENVSVKW